MVDDDVTEVRILVGDDEPDMRMLVQAHLRRVPGWTATAVGDGDAALEAVRTDGYDVVVLDQRMPRRTGIEVARALRAEGVTVPIVLFSGYLDVEIQDEADRLAVATLDKSDILRLPDVVRRVLDGA